MHTLGRTDWARMLLRTPLVIGGVVAVVLSTRAMRVRRAVRRVSLNDLREGRATKLLHSAIQGVDKKTIASALGPPRIALHRGSGYSGSVQRPYFAADTWYYPLDSLTHTALVIEFEQGVVGGVSFLSTPTRQIA